ncbi:hypothetical protein LTR66_006823 [Elasticomyces elasticus]|nr:hypothetical protein LTR66_006823 [Elasticomyces elasticus]KAK5011393.1 hypothetical protein LTR28_003500 [Elasticomyces elasticus]
MATTTITAVSKVQLSPEHLGVYRVPNISAGSLEEANRLLQKNHDEIHMFWRDANGHNHTVHNILTSLALGATPTELQQAFDDTARDQVRAKPDPDPKVVQDLYNADVFYANLGSGKQYPNFLAFFEQEIENKGWQAVLNEYCFSRSRNAEALLARLFEGAYHSIIHVGLGVEFKQPSIIAEGLAQAAGDGAQGLEGFFHDSDKLVDSASQPLAELLHEAYSNETIHRAAKWEDGPNKIRAGVLGRAGDEIAQLAAKLRIKPDELQQRTAEMISCVAYMATAAQRRGKLRKIDFFYMHNVTSSIFLTVLTRQDFIKLEDRVRLLEYKGRSDLVWYAACGAPKLQVEDVASYGNGASAGMNWDQLFRAINEMHDDGHVAKFVRALKSGEEVSKGLEENNAGFPIKGDLWLKAAQMAYATILDLPGDQKWLFFAGFDQAWAGVASTA